MPFRGVMLWVKSCDDFNFDLFVPHFDKTRGEFEILRIRFCSCAVFSSFLPVMSERSLYALHPLLTPFTFEGVTKK